MVWLQSMSSSLTDALVSTFNQAIINTEFKHEFGIQQCVSSSFEKKKKRKKNTTASDIKLQSENKDEFCWQGMATYAIPSAFPPILERYFSSC